MTNILEPFACVVSTLRPISSRTASMRIFFPSSSGSSQQISGCVDAEANWHPLQWPHGWLSTEPSSHTSAAAMRSANWRFPIPSGPASNRACGKFSWARRSCRFRHNCLCQGRRSNGSVTACFDELFDRFGYGSGYLLEITRRIDHPHSS